MNEPNHLQQARALTRVLRDLGMLPDCAERLAEARERHYLIYPRLNRIRLHHLWTGLHIGIAVFGIILALIPAIQH
jgi:hypothetical protein